MTDKLKLVGVPETPEEPQKPTYPHTNIQFGPLGSGFAINIVYANDIVTTKVFDGQAEAQLCDMLMQRRREARQQAELVRNIEKSKLH